MPASAAIQVWAIRKLDGKSTVKAFVDLRIGGVSLKGCKIVQQPEQHAWLVPGVVVVSAIAIQRTTFSTSRTLEFCSPKELVAQTGHEPADWPLVVIRELIDNALDACEEAGTAPFIRLTVARGRIRVRDNGPGLPPETVASILDFTTRTSSREAYVAPDRGRQGNALKTILAMPLALSGDEGRVEIVARGIRHEITFRVERIAQRPVVDHRQHCLSGMVRTGTAITVHWPALASSDLEAAGSNFLPLVTSTCDFNRI